ncbi:MAG: sigma-70 family RNA polymerase sigma factor [Chloroflexi bacterium]|nr:sigma-70 family RNA polymerase sigma factor [Chloroflexota bacterium]
MSASSTRASSTPASSADTAPPASAPPASSADAAPHTAPDAPPNAPGLLYDSALTARANTLALDLQAGQADVLPELVELFQPLLKLAVRRYRSRSLSLPAALDLDDLRQQGWLILDVLARRWDPAGGDFPAYVRTTLPWELWRYVKAQTPSRRARSVRVDNIQHDILMDRLEDRTGTDGRQWDDQIIAAEMLSDLDPIARWVFLLRLLEDRSFLDVAKALRLTQTMTYRAYLRALDQLRLRAGLELDPDDALGRLPGHQPAVERLVEALHAGTSLHGRLPGRAVICAQTGLSEVRFARLMGLLVTSGCIVGRTARQPGRLVHATAAETLAHLRRPPEQLARQLLHPRAQRPGRCRHAPPDGLPCRDEPDKDGFELA